MMVGCSLLPDEMKRAEQMMETNPDSALYILQHMEQTHKLTDSNRALYGILLFQALDKNNKPLGPDSVINFSVRYYEETKDKEQLARGYYYKAKLYKRAQQFDQATMLYLKALDNSKEKKQYALLGKIYSDLGDICAIQMDYNDALKKYYQAIEVLEYSGDTIEASFRVIDIGRVYRLSKDYQKAQIFYKKALMQTPDSLLQGATYQEMGINYYWAKKYDSAQYFLKESLNYPYKGNNYAIRHNILAELFFDIKQYDSAFLYASNALKYPSTFFNQRDCYRILANTEYIRGNLQQLELYMTKYQDCSDSVRKIEIQTKTTVLENLHQTNDAFSKSKQFQFVLGGVILVIVMFAFIIVYQLRARNKKKQLQLEQTEEKLTENAVKLTEKQLLLRDGLKKKIEENKIINSAQYKKANILQREQLYKEIYQRCLHYNDWEDFKMLMNQTFNNIISRIESNYPDINQKEKIWCCLFLLEIPNSEMSLILESQPASLYKLKQRVAQKMNLTGTRELEQLLLAFSNEK